MERVYVGNLPPDIRIKDIDDFFRPFGKLVAIDVNNRSNPAFAFVQFDSQRNALSAVRNRHGYDYEGYTLQVKLVENNVGSFEVRNQSRQVTPPPPPPMFNNDFNNQSQMGGGFGNNNFGRNGGNFGGNNFGSNNFGSNNFGNDFNLSSSSSFQRNMPSQNMIQYPSKNVRSIMPAQNNMIEYPINKGWGSGGGGAGVSNRGGGGFSNRGGRSDMGNDFNNMGGGYSFNPNNNCYADDNFEDRFTQGLSGSGRKWFNRYIQKGFAPKIAREKAIEHRTLPYLRDGPKSNQIANNAVANLPLPALENFGNKLISLFSGNVGGGGNFGGNANQMMPNFNNWGNNMQGGFSNDFNTAGPGSSNYRSGNRNTDRALMPRRGGGAAMNRNVKPNTAKGPESGILDKMLAEIPSLKQQNQVARKQFNKSMDILKKLDKESQSGLTRQGVRDKKYNEKFVREYHIWKNKQGILPYNSNSAKSVIKNKNNVDAKKITKKTENTIKGGTTTKSKEPIPSINQTPKQLLQSILLNKRKLLTEINRTNPSDDLKRLTVSRKKKIALLKEKVGIKDEQEAKTLSRLPKEKLEILFTLSADYKLKTGKSINDTNDIGIEEERFKNRKLKAAYRSAFKYLRKFEEHDLDTLTEKEKVLLRIYLRKTRRAHEERGLPLAPSRFDYLLTEVVDLSETKEDNKSVKHNTEENRNISTTTDSAKEEENIENEDNADDTIENANEDEKNEDASEDLTKKQDDEVESDVEIIEEENDQDNEKITEEEIVLDNKNEKE